MSRRKVRFILGALAVAGGLALAPPNAAAAGGATQEAGPWGVALQWVARVWEEAVARVWEGTVPPEIPTSDEGWGIDPNG